MVKTGDYKINNYQGGYSSFDSEYGKDDFFTGYRMSAKDLAITTDGRTANVLKSLSDSISKGTKNIEVGSISPAVLESVPKQQLKEVNRLSKLTGVDLTVHAPVTEASGISQQGFSESNRAAIERQMNLAIERSHEMNPQGNIPVNFHTSAGIPGDIPEAGKEHPDEILIIDSDGGNFGKIPLRKSSWLGEEKINIDEKINEFNKDVWLEKIKNMTYYADIGASAIKDSATTKKIAEAEKRDGKEISREEKIAELAFTKGETYLDDAYRQLEKLYEISYRHAGEKDKKILENFREEVKKDIEAIKRNPKREESIILKEQIIQKGEKVFKSLSSAPKVYQRLNDFAFDKSTETFSNVALNSYEKFKDTAPVVVIENPPAGGAFSTGEELKNFIKESRKKFVEKAVSKGILSKSEAEKQAKKLIGATWDVGHINMLKRYGYSDKDIIKETEKVAPFVKHVHLSDNFGFEHTELPMGMGNVPLKEMMEKLPKKDIKKVIEAISWYEHFKTPAVTQTMEAFGSPIYDMKMAPYWNQSLGLYQDYSSGYGQMLPQINYETFGAGFSQLPMELGGQRQGAQGSRMSGRPME